MDSQPLPTFTENTTASKQIPTELKYYISLLSFLSILWLVTMTWFYLNLKMHFSLPVVSLWLGLMLLTLGISHIWAYRRKNRSRQQNPIAFNRLWFGLLTWIMLLNTGLLYETGGTINPLVHLLLLPLALGMLILSPRFFMSLAMVSAALYLLLSSYYVPIMSMKVNSLQAFFAWHLHGSMLVFMLLVLFLALFILPLKHRLEKQKAILEHHRNLALQNEYLLSVAGLASASAHQLSTPLNTLSLIEELLKNEVDSEAGRDYLNIFSEQLQVCNKALQTLRNRADYTHHAKQRSILLSEFLSDLNQEFALIQPQSSLQIHIDPQLQPTESFELKVDESFKLALMNLLDNAARYSPDFIGIAWSRNDNVLQITIQDHGGGVEETQLNELGQQPCNECHGLGMGVFLSRMIIQRMNGHLNFRNRTFNDADKNETGLEVEILLPVHRLNLKEIADE
ncbi:HAMP domain-containing sensor histidine kinase [Thiomicrorhabdus sp.]|uniref:sensor histidine kinase n=1 Tax=Thiomicrorhabdus sp. TaxID=2039724 RepID=UPI0029C70844|nr:HAMP domain-containing sensor histidine kinase [Thiomicrorhabdus sp.]